VADPAAHEVGDPRDPITVALKTAAPQALDFRLELGAGTFVRVQRENPVIGGPFHGVVFLVDKARPVTVKNLVRIEGANIQSAVPASAVHNHNFVNPAQTFQGLRDVTLFVMSNNRRGNPFHIDLQLTICRCLEFKLLACPDSSLKAELQNCP